MSPDQQPTFRFYRGEELKEDGKKERRRRIVRGGGSLVRELWRQREEGLFATIIPGTRKATAQSILLQPEVSSTHSGRSDWPIREAAIPNPV